jgi:NADH-quinone oxidoreductase subunit N
MTTAALASITPLVVLAATVVATAIAIAIHRSHRVTAVLSIAGLTLAFVSLFTSPGPPPDASLAAVLVTMDVYARLYGGLILAAVAAVALLSYGYLEEGSDAREEYYLLLLLAALGSLVLVAAAHFASFFLGLELLSVSLYALIAYRRTRSEGLEAGLKYLVLAATSAAFLLFGMALVYADLGTLEFARMQMPAIGTAARAWTMAGMALVVVGFGFKLALVPFHLWTPDVYQGAPAPVTALVATVSKGAMFALLFRFASLVDLTAHRGAWLAVAAIAVASMVAGNLLALLQANVKRLLAYSSIAHLGYLLVAFLAGGAMAASAVAVYLTVYFIATIGAFGIVTVLSGVEREAEDLDDYRGLFARRPWLAGVLAGMLFSLAGIPFTAGFVAKFYLTAAAGRAALWGLLVVMMLTSGIGLFYYLRVIVAMFMHPVREAPEPRAMRPIPLAAGLTLATLAILLVWFGLYPAPLVSLAGSAGL